MPDFPASLAAARQTISSASFCSGSGQVLFSTNATINNLTAWPSANLAIYMPFAVESVVSVTAYQMAVENGATVNGNLDVGIYNLAGTKLVSSGSTAQSGASAIQTLNIADTVLAPGLYYMAMATDSVTATYRNSSLVARVARIAGCREQATAFALPSTATFAAFATASFVPWVSVALRPTI